MQKLLKNSLLALALLTTGGSFVACKGKGADANAATEKKGVQGSWEMVSAEGPGSEGQKGVTYEFTADELSMKAGMITSRGKYTVNGNKLVWKPEGLNTDFNYTFTLSADGNELSLELADSGGQKFKLKRK